MGTLLVILAQARCQAIAIIMLTGRSTGTRSATTRWSAIIDRSRPLPAYNKSNKQNVISFLLRHVPLCLFSLSQDLFLFSGSLTLGTSLIGVYCERRYIN